MYFKREVGGGFTHTERKKGNRRWKQRQEGWTTSPGASMVTRS